MIRSCYNGDLSRTHRYPVCFPTPCAFFICFYFTECFSTHDPRDSIMSPELPPPDSVNLVDSMWQGILWKKETSAGERRLLADQTSLSFPLRLGGAPFLFSWRKLNILSQCWSKNASVLRPHPVFKILQITLEGFSGGRSPWIRIHAGREHTSLIMDNVTLMATTCS